MKIGALGPPTMVTMKSVPGQICWLPTGSFSRCALPASQAGKSIGCIGLCHHVPHGLRGQSLSGFWATAFISMRRWGYGLIDAATVVRVGPFSSQSTPPRPRLATGKIHVDQIVGDFDAVGQRNFGGGENVADVFNDGVCTRMSSRVAPIASTSNAGEAVVPAPRAGAR